MHTRAIGHWQHDHAFDQDKPRLGERRTFIVIGLTVTAMAVEIAAGLVLGSMALLADGLHMASHSAALGITVFAYIYVRRNAHNPRWAFGTGKVNALAGFASAVMLALFALVMAWESVHRLLDPVPIVFDQAIVVAFIGLAVNAASVRILGVHKCSHAGHSDHAHSHGDHNLRAAYLHVLADALTSLLAIVALLAGKFYGLVWMDPLMGIIGAVLVARWSLGLLRSTSSVLLDEQAPAEVRQAITSVIEGNGDDRISDLHVWSIGPDIFAAIISVVTHHPRPPNHYKKRLPRGLGIAHTTVEVHHCQH